MLIADTHVHIYPVYNAAAFLNRAYENLSHLNPDAANNHYALFLTERDDCNFFASMVESGAAPTGYRIEKTNDEEALILVKESGGQRVLLFAGHQHVSSEGVEVLSLTGGAVLKSALSASETIRAVRDEGGVPVLCWAPGKWTGLRGRIVRSIIDAHGGEPLLLGDTSMRAIGVPEPSLFKAGREKNIPIATGTDPLPFTADERIAGTYGIASDAFDENKPVTSARALLTRGTFSVCGRRSHLPVSMKRWLSNQTAKSS